MANAPVRDQLADHLITPKNSALIVIDYQDSQFATVRSMDTKVTVNVERSLCHPERSERSLCHPERSERSERSRRTSANALSLSKRTKDGSLRQPSLKKKNVLGAIAVIAASLLFFANAPSAAQAATNWTVIVGGQTPDISVYANGFFPRELTVHTGDTVQFQFAGFHNVSFLSGAAAPPLAIKSGDGYGGNPQVFFPAGASTYDGTGFHGSGIPPSDKPFSYLLTFTKAGRYEYACTLHPGMIGIINVVDSAVTETPDAALARGKAEQAATLAAGTKAYDGMTPQINGSNVVVTLLGSNQDRYSVLRFTHDPLVVPVGTTVTWTVNDPFEVHTVTFASGAPLPQFITAQPQPGGLPKIILSTAALTPTTATAYDGTGWINSGLIGAPGAPSHAPTSFSLKFTKPGRYEYWCLVHDEAHQEGVIIVK
jgi:plastocyanin